jgi:1-acyl-sn-glycerol-3-phosphate acyltransferase
MTRLAEKWLKWRGWRFVGEMPELDKMIIIGAPHTSNWDFVAYLAAIRHWRFSPRFVGKHTLFRWPFGYFFRRFGGIPVDRTRPGGMVGQVAEEFIRIAAEAGVPILPVYIHFPRKEVVLGSLISFEGDETALMEELRRFYEAGEGKDGEGKGPVRLEKESSV